MDLENEKKGVNALKEIPTLWLEVFFLRYLMNKLVEINPDALLVFKQPELYQAAQQFASQELSKRFPGMTVSITEEPVKEQEKEENSKEG